MSKSLFTKIYKPFIAFILAVVLACIATLPNVKKASAENGNGVGTQILFDTGEVGTVVSNGNVLYVSDIKIASAKKGEDAIKELEDAGYYVQKSDLNKGNSGYVYLGYKLTSNRAEAITGLKVANMTSGYTAWDYREFLKEEAEGLPVSVDGLMSAVSEFKRLYKSGNVVTKYAYDTLNVLCVPETTKQKTGTPLGEYLLSDDRTYADFETLILILPGSTLTFINNQLAVGCSNNFVNQEGDKLTWVSNPYFLHDIADKIEAYVATVEESSDEAGMTALLLFKYGIDGDTLISKENFSDIIDEPMENALKGASLGIEIDNVICTSLYDVLFSDSRVLHALFAKYLPENVAPSEFGKVLKSYASDTEKRVPGDVPSLPNLISPWMQNATEYLNNTIQNPFYEDDREIIFENNKDINSELEFFVELVENFIYEYWDQKEACADVLEELGYDLTTEEMLRELSSRVAEENEDSDQTGKISSDAFMYLATYEVLKQYRFIDREYFESWDDYGDTFYVTNLADYMELIANTAYDDEETARALSCAFLSGMS
ncbi:MAG: hypothetical protein MJ072_02815, partial [Clostridia bacterium]|nr:hypothetical protein [Clostridia bacterium]